ncbi:phosphoenolpyruvate phosphomutase [Paraburkholderia sacchari]|uniref:phosphoenolpyruvate mutase n=1 Tax=Paraburkholderia sacchari TaxID=159450 RepID=UPI0039A6D591
MNAREPATFSAAVPAAASTSRSARLRQMLVSNELEFLMEAHNGLSARIAREAGFKAIWGSGLSISAQFGVRDNNEASWTQVVDNLEFMADASDLPILLDGDTGYGNFNNVRRLVRKLEQRGIAGVCIEDKQFPKTNSFIKGEAQPLADMDEFCGKIKAGKDSQHDENFSIVARVEALIAGWGMDEALKRAEAYRLAGADAILIHSKLSKPDEILTFAREWAGRGPLVIVPTKYYSTPTDAFRKAGISVVIWANHLVRASASAMQAVAKTIHETQTLVDVEDRIASVNEIFRLQDADEYSEAENRYLSASRTAGSAIVLAASRGSGLDAFTEDKPKVMLPVAGKPLLRWLVDAFKKQSVNDITVVGGYRADAIDTAGVKLVRNERYGQTNELASLACAIGTLKNDTVISYGDLLFRSYILRDLVESEADFSVVVDSSPESESSSTRDFAWCSSGDDRGLFGNKVLLERIASEPAVNGETPHGRWIGLMNVRGAGREKLAKTLARLQTRADFDTLDMPALLNALIADGEQVEVQYVRGHWRGVNDLEDFRRAGDFAQGVLTQGVVVPGVAAPGVATQSKSEGKA